jgi:hypothetical protein
MPIHYIEVDPIGACGIDGADLLAQFGEIRGQDRGRDDEGARRKLLGHVRFLKNQLRSLRNGFRVTRASLAGNASCRYRIPTPCSALSHSQLNRTDPDQQRTVSRCAASGARAWAENSAATASIAGPADPAGCKKPQVLLAFHHGTAFADALAVKAKRPRYAASIGVLPCC